MQVEIRYQMHGGGINKALRNENGCKFAGDDGGVGDDVKEERFEGGPIFQTSLVSLTKTLAKIRALSTISRWSRRKRVPKSVLCHRQIGQFRLNRFQYVRIGFRLHLSRGDARTGVALRMRTFRTLRVVGRIRRERFVALVATEVRYSAGAELIARVSVRILVFLRSTYASH